MCKSSRIEIQMESELLVVCAILKVCFFLGMIMFNLYANSICLPRIDRASHQLRGASLMQMPVCLVSNRLGAGTNRVSESDCLWLALQRSTRVDNCLHSSAQREAGHTG